MALSFFTKWGTDHHEYLVPEMGNSEPFSTFQENFGFSDTYADPLLLEADDDQYLYSDDSIHHLLPYFSYPADHLISLSPEIFPPQEELEWELMESHQLYPKRQKVDVYYDHQPYYLDFPHGYCPPHISPDLIMPQLQVPMPEFQTPPQPLAFYGGCVSGIGSGSGSGGKKGERESLSAQSIAARQRRRKITEKTQELGKLIPGGNKMNTAEMFQAAFKYIKFLQAQVAMLQLMASLQYNEEILYVEELQATASPIIQEKLYFVEKCLVPKKFLETLANDEVLLQSNHSILNGLQPLIQPND